MSYRQRTLPNELIYTILEYVADQPHGFRTLASIMPANSQVRDISRSLVYRELQIEPVNARYEAQIFNPDIAWHVRNLYLQSHCSLAQKWLNDTRGLCRILAHSFPRLQKLGLGFITWSCISNRNKTRLIDLTLLPTFESFQAIGVTELPLALFTGMKGLKHLEAYSITLSTEPVALPHYTGRRSHLDTLTLGFEGRDRPDISWPQQVQGIVSLLDLIRSTASPISLTRLRVMSINLQLVTTFRPSLCRALQDCSATLQSLKIHAGGNHEYTDAGLTATNERLDLSHHTALKSIIVQIGPVERDRLDFLIHTLNTLGPSTPLRELTICLFHDPTTPPLLRSTRWAHLDDAFARLRKCYLHKVKFVLLVCSCECVLPQRCHRCSLERQYGQAIVDSLPRLRSAGAIDVIKTSHWSIVEFFQVPDRPDIWKNAISFWPGPTAQ